MDEGRLAFATVDSPSALPSPSFVGLSLAGVLRAMEARWQALGGLCPRLHSSWGEAEVLSSDMLVATLFSLGTRVGRPWSGHRSWSRALPQAFAFQEGEGQLTLGPGLAAEAMRSRRCLALCC